MLRQYIKNLYMGKSRLKFENSIGQHLPSSTLIHQLMSETEYVGNMPDYMAYGRPTYEGNKITGFQIDFKGNYRLLVTGIPKGEILDNFRIQRCFWSSYYEDSYRGYLFQITDEYPKLIIKK